MVTQSDILNPPASWSGSRPEWMFYSSLIQLGYQPDEDFVYQSPLLGGRLDKGGWIIDFVFNNPPNLAVNIQGIYYHYELGADNKARDIFAREALAGQGIYNPPNIAINVQGVFYHYEKGAAVRQSDILRREYLATLGIKLIFVDEDDLEQDPVGITREALQFRDSSRLGGR